MEHNRSSEMVIKDLRSILEVQEKNIVSAVSDFNQSESKARRLQESVSLLSKKNDQLECRLHRAVSELSEARVLLNKVKSDYDQQKSELDKHSKSFAELNQRYINQGRQHSEVAKELNQISFTFNERQKKIVELESKNSMLSQQVELFESERKQLVEAAFRANKETKTVESNLKDVLNQRDALRELLAKEVDLKNEYYVAKSSITFYKAVSVVALIAVLVLTIMVAR
jgi:DNA repair exonuclease SbcCD ATPase subunit